MKQKRIDRIRATRQKAGNRRHEGFSIMEMLVALCIFLPLMIGAAQLFEVVV